jgi:uncharacterized membrane protein (UPF0127 family)
VTSRRRAVRALALAVALGCAAGLAGCASDEATVAVGDAPVLSVEVADSPEERATGLSGRTELPAGTGMAFVWDEPTRASFWMQDTLVPLSIAWVHDGQVVDVAEMEPCPPATACPFYEPSDPDAIFDLAVEAPGGFFTETGVAPGDPVTRTGF